MRPEADGDDLDEAAELHSFIRLRSAPGPRPRLEALAGGVSSVVIAVHDGAGGWLAKTPLAQLAVADEWRADRSRAGREAEVLKLLDGSLGPLRVPRLVAADPVRHLLAMELIGGAVRSWKVALLAGEVDAATAAALGQGMSSLHRRPVPEPLSGPAARALFETLRVDPYYRTTAERVPALAVALGHLIADSAEAAVVAPALVHGDLNPKNVLLTAGAPVLLDWEIAHAGDPAFDLGMLGAHLLLKGCRDGADPGPYTGAVTALWDAYSGPARRDLAVRHTGGILAARLFGKSPVDYLPRPRERVRAMALARMALSGVCPSIGDLCAALGGYHHA